jgi:hypothetical protein
MQLLASLAKLGNKIWKIASHQPEVICNAEGAVFNVNEFLETIGQS